MYVVVSDIFSCPNAIGRAERIPQFPAHFPYVHSSVLLLYKEHLLFQEHPWICSDQIFVLSSLANCLVFRIVSFCSRSFKASHILISGDGLVTLSGLSHLHSLVKHGQRHRAVFDFPQFSTSVQPWLSPELLRQVRCGRCIGLSVRLECLLSLTKGQLWPYIWIGECTSTARLFPLFLIQIIMLGI